MSIKQNVYLGAYIECMHQKNKKDIVSELQDFLYLVPHRKDSYTLIFIPNKKDSGQIDLGHESSVCITNFTIHYSIEKLVKYYKEEIAILENNFEDVLYRFGVVMYEC